MKLFKLIAHQKNFSGKKTGKICVLIHGRNLFYLVTTEEEIVLNSKDFPHVKVKDIVEVYHPEDSNSRVLLQVHSLKDEIMHQVKGEL